MFVQRQVTRGDTLPFRLEMETDETGAAWQSFAGYRLRFSVKARATDPDNDAIVALTSDAGGGINAGVSAIWSLVATSLVPGGMYCYDVQMENLLSGAIITIERGMIAVLHDVTRAPQSSP